MGNDNSDRGTGSPCLSGLFVTNPEERPPNFKVRLNMSQAGGVQKDGTGALVLTKSLGKKFKRLREKGHISVVMKGKTQALP